MNQDKIALVEVTKFHEECLYTQVKFSKNHGLHVTLIINEDLPLSFKEEEVDDIVYIRTNNKINKSYSWLLIHKHLIKNKINVVVFNTAESFIYKLIRLPFPKSIQLIGILHNAQKLKSSRKQKFISQKISKYLVLSEFIKESISQENLFLKPIEVFKPTIFPKFKTKVHKPTNDIWITIPGTVNLNKRDYHCLSSMSLRKDIKIILLGKPENSEAKIFLKELSDLEIFKNFILFDKFIDFDLYHSYISQSDFILPLIHPNNETFESFIKYKISGSYNLAYGYNIPLLMAAEFKAIHEFNGKAIFYNQHELKRLFLDIDLLFEASAGIKLVHSKEHYQNIFNEFILH